MCIVPHVQFDIHQRPFRKFIDQLLENIILISLRHLGRLNVPPNDSCWKSCIAALGPVTIVWVTNVVGIVTCWNKNRFHRYQYLI